MPEVLSNVIRFRGDRLFNGAVNLGWLHTDDVRTNKAANAFVFHGPAYHGVSQADIGDSHGHRLQDTARFSESVLRRCLGLEDQPFTLAIAGYGTGKSHLGLTLGALLRDPDSETASAVLKGITSADAEIGNRMSAILAENRQPCLVVAINGMQSFDLTTEVTRQIVAQVKSTGLDTRPLDELRPRFAQAASLIKMAMTNSEVMQELLEACDTSNIADILTRLDQQDEQTYSAVHKILSSINIHISALGGESVRDVIDVAAREYCGIGKPFRSLVILFDEFGRYTEFATVKSHVAGSGVLQDLFEGIQANAEAACFVGFIQFELNAYVQRVAPEHRNEILRYITRYQSASRVYLSINLETLIANLIEKKDPGVLDALFNREEAGQESEELMANIGRWFPQSANHSLWSNREKFHNVIRKGCWPLSAYSTWFLFYLAAGGKHLQERSALALLGDLLERCGNQPIPEDAFDLLAPVDFWSDHLQQELITAEESGQQGSITHSYASIESRHGAQFDNDLRRLLRAVVLASKLGLKASGKDDAVEAIAELAGLHLRVADQGIQMLRDEYNVLEWDESFKAFDILGDAVPRTQFLSFVRQRVASSYDEAGKAKLFASKAANWCDLLKDLDCDFAEENRITTREWRYQAETANLDFLLMQFKHAADRWKSAIGVDEPRGTIIFCYVEPSRDIRSIEKDATNFLKAEAQSAGVSALPIWVVLLHDEDGGLGQALAELAVLEDSLSAADRSKYGNLIGAHQEKILKNIRIRIEAMIKQRLYISALKEPLESRRISRVGTEIFGRIYKSPMVFPFDGFTTAKGNAADSCMELTAELIQGRLDWSGVISKPVKVKNRAESVLKDSWGVFAQNGSIKIRPSHPILRSLTEKWDKLLSEGEQRIALKDALVRLCAPPYGANIASAGLFLGAFIAARTTKLILIRNGVPITFSEWIQSGLFRGKFIDVNGLHDIELMLQGDESSEWDDLLNEWEEAESYASRIQCYVRADELKKRVPVPPAQAYREVQLEGLSKTALIETKKLEENQNSALSKIENGQERSDASLLSWGTSELADLLVKMVQEKPLWSDHEIEQIQPVVERSRQILVQIFPDWLKRQMPKDGSVVEVGNFRHKMLHKIGAGLKKLSLEEQYSQLEEHTSLVIRQVESLATAQQTVRDVQLWIASRAGASQFIRVIELRAAQQEGKEYSAKLRGLSSRIDLPEIGETRVQLSNALASMKEAEAKVGAKVKKLKKSKLASLEEVQCAQDEVTALITVYEGDDDQLQELQLMRKFLQMNLLHYQQLNNESLDWAEFMKLTEKLKKEVLQAFSAGDLVWDGEKVLNGLSDSISAIRTERSSVWTATLEESLAGLESLNVSDANRLHGRASTPPSYITKQDDVRRSTCVQSIEKRLNALKVDWLVEKFKELPEGMQSLFLERIAVKSE